MTNPVPAELWWRTALSIYLITGLRCEDVCSYTAGVSGLLLENLHLESTPCPWANADVAWPHGWLGRFAEKTGKPVIVPLPQPVRVHLDALLRLRRQSNLAINARSPVFTCPQAAGGTKRNRRGEAVHTPGFYTQWRAIIARAREIRPIPDPCLPHDLRRTAAGLWERARPGLGQHILGHSSEARVHRDSYQNLVPLFADSVGRLQLPRAISDGAERLHSAQKLLF